MSQASSLRPAVDYLALPEDAEPYLTGCRCSVCDAVYAGSRSVCSRCTARDQMQPMRLANKGHLYTYAIVHRSFPGIQTPFVSAVVDLDGGGTIKGNLVDVDPDPACIAFGMSVNVVYRDALGRTDADGHRYLSYFFVPAAS